MDYLSFISQKAIPPAYRVGLTLDHRWDQAWRLFYPKLNPTKQEISNFLNRSFEILAIETYYKTVQDTDCFFGFEYSKKSSLNHKLFIEKYFEVINKTLRKQLIILVNQLSSEMYGADKLFMHSDPSEIFLSNRYSFKSGGPCVIWKKGESKNISKTSLITKLGGYPSLLVCDDDYTSIEFIFNSDPKHWFSYQVSKKDSDNKYRLNLDEVEKLLKMF